MPQVANRWSLILAAGSGTRLQSLTTDRCGAAVPKQFCSLNGGASLLEETFARAHAFSAERRTLVIVAAEHRAYWLEALADLPSESVIVQPVNRGTANGILLGVTAILEREPDALVTVLPSDHYVASEDILRRSLSRALALAETPSGADAIHFLGIRPELPDAELGYIVRGAQRIDGTFEIARFIEKPGRDLAASLVERGALWNSFILVARASALAALVEQRFAGPVAAFKGLWGAARVEGVAENAKRLYAQLPEIDFSRDVVEGAAADLRVVPVPYCGWSDLGTPTRVAACLERLAACAASAPSRHLNLAEAYGRLM